MIIQIGRRSGTRFADILTGKVCLLSRSERLRSYYPFPVGWLKTVK